MSKARNPWMQISWDAWMLGAEAATVMTLGAMKIAAGDDRGGREASRIGRSSRRRKRFRLSP